GAPRKNHTWDTRHLARPIRDVGSADRRESVSGARCKCGFGDTWQLALVKDLSVARDGADQGLGGIVDGRWCGECAARPSEGIPNSGTPERAVGVVAGTPV